MKNLFSNIFKTMLGRKREEKSEVEKVHERISRMTEKNVTEFQTLIKMISKLDKDSVTIDDLIAANRQAKLLKEDVHLTFESIIEILKEFERDTKGSLVTSYGVMLGGVAYLIAVVLEAVAK